VPGKRKGRALREGETQVCPRESHHYKRAPRGRGATLGKGTSGREGSARQLSSCLEAPDRRKRSFVNTLHNAKKRERASSPGGNRMRRVSAALAVRQQKKEGGTSKLSLFRRIDNSIIRRASKEKKGTAPLRVWSVLAERKKRKKEKGAGLGPLPSHPEEGMVIVHAERAREGKTLFFLARKGGSKGGGRRG